MRWEREIFQTINCELCQPTLLNFYKEFVDDGQMPPTENIPESHWLMARDIIADYKLLQGKGILELKTLFLTRLKKI
jgi:hypothetical protein